MTALHKWHAYLMLGKLYFLSTEVGKRDISNTEITSRHIL